MNGRLFLMLLHKYMSSKGEAMLWMILVVTIIMVVFLLWRAYRLHKANPLRIRKKVWYSGGLKMVVKVRNISQGIVEIDPPEIEFRQPHKTRRRFKIVAPGDKDVFPLGLSPQTSYEFLVEFIRLYEREEFLRSYKQVIIRIKNRSGKVITRKKVKLSLPK